MRFFNLVFFMSTMGWSATADATKYTFDQSGSSVTFHNTASLHGIDGVAKQFGGSFDSGAGTGSLVVQTKSMTTNLGPRDNKMHDFCLESDKYPTIEFAVTGMGGGVEGLKAKAKRGKIALNGTLKIRDTKKTISVPTSFVTMGDDLTLQGEFDFNWQDYNVPDPSILISTLYPDMSVKFSLKLKGEPAPAAPAEAAPADAAPAEAAPAEAAPAEAGE
jgi:polyisoprenoid-binding protein YceI